MKMKRKMISFFLFFQAMEHWWNKIDTGKPKYSGKNLSQCHFVHHKSHMDWPGTRASAVRGRRLTAWAMARPNMRVAYLFLSYIMLMIIADCTKYFTGEERSSSVLSAWCGYVSKTNR
jgi:hypothetical protein